MISKHSFLFWIHIVIPVIIMFSLAYSSFSELTTSSYSSDLIIASLLLYFPLLFLLQGALCALLKGNIFISLGISILAFIIILFIWLNRTAIIYLFVYAFLNLLSYGLVRFIIQRRSK